MKNFEDSEMIKQKALVKKILDELAEPYEKINKICLKQANEILAVENDLKTSEDLQKINNLSKKSEAMRKDFLNFLSLRNRIKTLICRNTQRKNFIEARLGEVGIYNDKVTKQDLKTLQTQEKSNISAENFNLNPKGEKKRTKIYFYGELLSVVDGRLDMSDKANLQIFKSVDDEIFHKIIFEFPECVGEISPEFLIETNFKKRVLKEVASFASEKSKTQNFKEINKALGSPLSFKSQITEDLESFVAGVQNAMNAKVCTFLAQRYPNKKDVIAGLKVNLKSELLPESTKVAVLANGLSGDVVTREEELSEELKISEKKLNKQNVAIENNLRQTSGEKSQNLDDDKAQKEQQKKAKEEAERQEMQSINDNDLDFIEQMLMGLKKEDDE